MGIIEKVRQWWEGGRFKTSLNLKLFGRLFKVSFETIALPDKVTVGITNRTKDGYFVPFFDYDNVEYTVVREDVDFFQKNYNLGTALVLVSSSYTEEITNREVGNYHVVFFTKHTFPEILDFLKLSRGDRKAYWAVTNFQQRRSVLRVLEKVKVSTGEIAKPSVKLKEIIPADTDKVGSTAHRMFYQTLLGVPINKLKYEDGLLEIEDIVYETK